jgi:hypothetical protein
VSPKDLLLSHFLNGCYIFRVLSFSWLCSSFVADKCFLYPFTIVSCYSQELVPCFHLRGQLTCWNSSPGQWEWPNSGSVGAGGTCHRYSRIMKEWERVGMWKGIWCLQKR